MAFLEGICLFIVFVTDAALFESAFCAVRDIIETPVARLVPISGQPFFECQHIKIVSVVRLPEDSPAPTAHHSQPPSDRSA